MKKQNLNEYVEFNDERFTKRIVFKEGESTTFVLNFKPGQSLPTHRHPGTNVYLLVVQGEGLFTIDGNEVPAQKDDVLVCDGNEEFSFTNNSSSNTNLYVMLNKIPNDHYAQDI